MIRREPNYHAEVEPPDIQRYAAGNSGIDYVIQRRGARRGPHLWINALTHGNEVCGAIALDYLLRHDVRPRTGLLTLSFANIRAFENRSVKHPCGRRFIDEDMNRVWNRLDGSEASCELERARQLVPIADSADYLVDLHSMDHPARPLAIVGVNGNPSSIRAGLGFVRRIGNPTLLVMDEGHAAGCRLRDYRPFARAENGRAAIVAECGAHWSRNAANVAIDISLRSIRNLLGLAREPGETPPVARPRPEMLVSSEVTVTAKTNVFRFADFYIGGEVIQRAGTLIARDGDEPIRTPFDRCFLLMPCIAGRGETPVRFGRIQSGDADGFRRDPMG